MSTGTLRRAPQLALVIATALSALVFSASAQATLITIGTPFTSSLVHGKLCGVTADTGCTYVMRSFTDPSSVAASPVNGAVLRWRTKGASQEDGYALRVLGNPGSRIYTGEGTALPEQIPISMATRPVGLGITAGLELNTQEYAADLPIHIGDHIGLNIPYMGELGEEEGGKGNVFFFTLGEGQTEVAEEEAGGYAFNADVLPEPTISSVGPTSGPVAGGTSVTIKGLNFEYVKDVSFGGSPATSYTVNSQSQITAVAPAGAQAGGISIAVTTLAGTATQPFSYNAPPSPVGMGGGSVSQEHCIVPRLKGERLKASRKRSRKADCRIGKVTEKDGVTAKSGRVIKQNPKPGRVRTPGSRISITLGD
jgi:hypothetical protein